MNRINVNFTFIKLERLKLICLKLKPVKVSLGFIIICLFPGYLFSQDKSENNNILQYKLETFASLSHDSITPFWITNNSYGVIPLESNNVYLRGSTLWKHYFNDSWRLEAEADLVLETNREPSFFVQQLYVSLMWKFLNLRIGSKENYHSMLNRELSSGDFCFSPNSRPIPEINLSVPEFISIPYMKNILYFRGDFAVGKFRDNNYILDFKNDKAGYSLDALLHHKSAFFLFKDPDKKFPLYLMLGIEHSVQWGGWTTHKNVGDLPNSFRDFVRVVLGKSGGEEAPDSEQINTLGNHLGTYNLKLGYLNPDLEIAAYKQHYFEDKSGMELANWRDGIWGMEATFLTVAWINKIVFEYIQTTNQSGSFLFPSEIPISGMNGRIGGNDNYYNNSVYSTGWSYFGRGIGNPLLTSPGYNSDGSLNFKNTRIKAWHIGLAGNFHPNLSYRILGTSIYSYGTMSTPFLSRNHAYAGLVECNYIRSDWKGWQIGVQIAGDNNMVLAGKNIGCSVKIAKVGSFNF